MPASRRQILCQLLFVAFLFVSPPARSAQTVEVELAGIEDEDLLNNVRTFLSIANPPEEEEQEEGWTMGDVRRLHNQAPAEIRQALRPFGYYQPEIDTGLRRVEGVWQARYTIDPGPPTRVEQVEVRVVGEGRDAPAIRRALRSGRIAEGGRLMHGDYEALKQSLYDAAYGQGYLDARYRRAEIRVQPEQRRAEIHLALDTGWRYYFGDITIQQDVLNPELVQRFVRIEPGDPFDTDELLDLQLALNDSGYFDHIELQADKEQARDQRVPVTVIARPIKPRHYNASVGYGTDTGPRLGLGVEFRRINRYGHRFLTDLQISSIKNSLSAQYQIPIEDVRIDRLAFTGTIQQEEIGDALSDQYILGASRSDSALGGRRRLYLNLLHENFSFSLEEDDGDATLLIPGIYLSRKRADDLFYPRDGYSVFTDLHGAAEAAISDTSFIQGTIGARRVFSLAERTRLLLRAEAGTTAVDDFDKLPPSQRFFAGGDRSVRGYDYQDLSPENALGEDIGGEHLIVGSVEVDHLFYGDFGAAVFFDAGDAFSDNFDPSHGTGLGFRWRSPIGMVRLDFAVPLDESEDDFRIHLSIGPDL